MQDGQPERARQVVQGREGGQEERPEVPHQERRRRAVARDQGGADRGLWQVHLQDRGVRKGGRRRDQLRRSHRR